ncbi:acyltransferase family protein [Prosthecobacter sp.]|jgi:predicted acyltransferase|uniref:acyltransferase family protein n=1 Tax=Prosthecobacter sp. TaxID=1965333 RepID=UPI0037C93EFD
MSPAPLSSSASSTRLLSLDALRGFDMCWILGLSTVVSQILNRAFPQSDLVTSIATQFKHVDWAGFRFYDLIFPLFLFLAGVSLAIALPRRLAREGRLSTIRHLLARAAILVVLGVIFSGGVKNGWDQIRWLGVLQRIGIASAAAGLLSLLLKTRGLTVAAAALLIGYFLLLRFVPVPGVGAGNFAEGMNLTNYLDSIWLPGRKHDGNHDPEGILSTLPAIATALLGLVAGKWITGSASPMRKFGGLIAAGLLLLALGWAWHPFFPIIKKIWSSSFVLVAAGWSAILLGLFYAIVDILGWRRGLAPFLWVGSNPIALYLCSGFGFFRTISERLATAPPPPYDWLPSAMTFAIMLATAQWLHKRQLFLKV